VGAVAQPIVDVEARADALELRREREARRPGAVGAALASDRRQQLQHTLATTCTPEAGARPRRTARGLLADEATFATRSS